MISIMKTSDISQLNTKEMETLLAKQAKEMAKQAEELAVLKNQLSCKRLILDIIPNFQ